MSHPIIRAAIACLVACGLTGCETAAPVSDSEAAKSATTPAAQTSAAKISNADPKAATEPGPDDPDAPTEFTTAPSGLKYRVLRKGSGKTPSASDRVTVNYKGWLDDGTVFDTSYHRFPFTFSIAGDGEQREVIEGWNEGVTYVSEGGKIELEIPGALGYGPGGFPPKIPANATLHFIVEVIEVQ